jgi:hypothetical protein
MVPSSMNHYTVFSYSILLFQTTRIPMLRELQIDRNCDLQPNVHTIQTSPLCLEKAGWITWLIPAVYDHLLPVDCLSATADGVLN